MKLQRKQGFPAVFLFRNCFISWQLWQESKSRGVEVFRMKNEILRNLSYGMYAIGVKGKENASACIVNTVFQVTSSPPADCCEHESQQL